MQKSTGHLWHYWWADSILCGQLPVKYLLFTVLPDHLEPFFVYDSRSGAINVQGLNNMIASNGTTGMIMVCMYKLVHINV